MRNSIHYNEVNEVMNCSKSVKNNIIPGMGATMYVGTDRYAMVVTHVISLKKVKVTYVDDLSLFSKDENGIDMMKPNELTKLQAYDDYTPCSGHSHGLLHTYTLRKNGRWMPAGKDMWGTCSIHIGHADEYIDPDF